MKLHNLILFGLGGVCLLAACTERRSASVPEASGDTVEVNIDPEKIKGTSIFSDSLSNQQIDIIEISD